MLELRRIWYGAVALVGLLAVAISGCGDLPAEPSHPPIPSFTESNTNCLVWSCESGLCPWDPGQYGACCIQVTEGNQTPTSRPSCGEPNYGGGGTTSPYCDDLITAVCFYTLRNGIHCPSWSGMTACIGCGYIPPAECFGEQ